MGGPMKPGYLAVRGTSIICAAERQHHIAAVARQSRHTLQEPGVAPGQAATEMTLAEHAPGHRQKLIALDFQRREYPTQSAQVAPPQRLLVAGPLLARVRQPPSGPGKQG